MKNTLLISSLFTSVALFSSCSSGPSSYSNVDQLMQQTVPSLPDNHEGAFIRGAIEFNDSISSGGRRYVPAYPHRH